MVALITFFTGLIGGFLLGKRHGARVERELSTAEDRVKAAVGGVQKRLDEIADKFK